MESRIGGIESHRWSPAQRVRLEFIFLICLSTIPFTPYGLRMAAYPFTVASSLPINVANVLEWQPMPFNLLGGKIFLALLLGFFLAQMALRFACRLNELALFVAGASIGWPFLWFVFFFLSLFRPPPPHPPLPSCASP